MGLKEEIRRLVGVIGDYEQLDGDLSTHVRTWINQFPKEKQEPLLRELNNVLEKTYINSESVNEFLGEIATNSDLTGDNPEHFWKEMNILRIQKGGNSQKQLLERLGNVLDVENIDLDECGSIEPTFLYIDDAIFSGNRLVNDLRDWIADECPESCKIIVLVLAYHTGGWFYAKRAIHQLATTAGKRVTLAIGYSKVFETFSNIGGAADVFRLRTLPTDVASQSYIERFRATGYLRGEANRSELFSSENARQFCETALWQAGLEVRDTCCNLKDTHRPLGYTSTNSANRLGFGSTLVTYRNCPNNCPLALWAGDPWYPLFPRLTN